MGVASPRGSRNAFQDPTALWMGHIFGHRMQNSRLESTCADVVRCLSRDSLQRALLDEMSRIAGTPLLSLSSVVAVRSICTSE